MSFAYFWSICLINLDLGELVLDIGFGLFFCTHDIYSWLWGKENLHITHIVEQPWHQNLSLYVVYSYSYDGFFCFFASVSSLRQTRHRMLRRWRSLTTYSSLWWLGVLMVLSYSKLLYVIFGALGHSMEIIVEHTQI